MRNITGTVILTLLLVHIATCMPQSLVVSTTTSASTTTETRSQVDKQTPFISRLQIRSNVQFRYARTEVISLIKNPSSEAKEIDFELLLPKKAFISNFTIEDKDQVYVSRVEEKKVAQETYDKAVSQGQTAGLVNAREQNLFGVRANVGPEEKLEFRLIYEEVLQRHVGKYQLSTHVNPKQIVKDLLIDVYINETLPVINVAVPTIKTSVNDIVSQLDDNEVATISGENSNEVHIEYRPSIEDQAKINKNDGVTGHFIVQYDVDRQGQDNEIQVVDGYFVHFFSPQNVKTLQKHIVFVLDVSGSMIGEKIQQLKDSMITILDDLKPSDYFSILTFSNGFKHWASSSLDDESPKPLFFPGSKDLKREAMTHVLKLTAEGGTNIYDSLTEAVNVVKNGIASEEMSEEVTPSIIFLTDGQPSASITNTDEIRSHLRTINAEVQVPVFGLAFGRGADFNFIQKMSEENFAFARKIYEGSDAAIQLEDFYAEVSSPLLTNVTFEYVGDSFEKQVTNPKSGKRFYKGSEIAYVGKLSDDMKENTEILLTGSGADGEYRQTIRPCILPRPVPFENDMVNLTIDWPMFPCIPHPHPSPPMPIKPHESNIIERMWAFMTIKNLLEDDTKDDEKLEEKQEALELALEYNFVTDLTSLVVVKPIAGSENATDNSTDTFLDLQPVDDSSRGPPYLSYNSYVPQNFFAAQPGVSSRKMISSHSRGGINPFIRSGTAGPVVTSGGGVIDLRSKGSYKPTATTRRTITTPNNGPIHDTFEESQGAGEASTTCPPPGTCNITLYSKTYLRGPQFTLTDSTFDFTENPLSTDATSLKIEGSCVWALHTETGGLGTTKKFAPGEYKSTDALGTDLFRNVKSITLLKKC